MNIDNTQGDLKILAMAVQALIDTHPNKEQFKKRFLEIIDDPKTHSVYSQGSAHPFNSQLLIDFLRTATYNSRIDSAPTDGQEK